MKIPVVGFDPSLRNWGIAEGMLDLDTGILSEVNLILIETEKGQAGKQVRVNSEDLACAEMLAKGAIAAASKAKAIFVECPVGSQSAAAMKGYGVCIGILGSIRAIGVPLIEVTPTEVKVAFTGDKNATKAQMIAKAVELYPTANFPMLRGRVTNKAEHPSDALAAIHAGVMTPVFQNLMRLLKV
jgi:Holliday junction resolvasome RuvABC endonuclease subunit